jgi:hypothetical protein
MKTLKDSTRQALEAEVHQLRIQLKPLTLQPGLYEERTGTPKGGRSLPPETELGP